MIDALKNVGCYTAKSVLAMDRNALIERADLEEQTVDEVLRILSAEFADDDSDSDEQPEETAPAQEEENEAPADEQAADDDEMKND